jgi:hypothetical protein
MPPGRGSKVQRLVGVYHASGTPWGELTYWVKARFGGGHCALCDITHGSIREKDEWRECRTQLAVPMTTLHLNERGDALRSFTDGHTPCVVAETDDGMVMLVGDDDLRSCDGSPECLVRAIEANATRLGLRLD